MSVGNSRFKYQIISASLPDDSEDEQQDEDDKMAWKRFRPSAPRSVCQSMYIGALISLLTPATGADPGIFDWGGGVQTLVQKGLLNSFEVNYFSPTPPPTSGGCML